MLCVRAVYTYSFKTNKRHSLVRIDIVYSRAVVVLGLSCFYLCCCNGVEALVLLMIGGVEVINNCVAAALWY